MAIQHQASGTPVNFTFTGATKQDLVSNLETQLVLAGWTVISGSGTTDVVLESGTTPTANNYIRVRLRSTNATNCATVVMQDAAAARVSQLFYLLPGAAKTYRILANKYTMVCTTGGNTAREFVMCATLYLPANLHGVITGALGFIQGNGTTDTDTSARWTFRSAPTATNNPLWSGLVNNNLIDRSGSGSQISDIRLLCPYSHSPSLNYRWHDGTFFLTDPLVMWGLANWTDEPMARGQLWGCMWISEMYAHDYALTGVEGHNWISITGANDGTQNSSTFARGTLFFATS